MKTISFVNQKGGVAKTTSALNIGAALAIAGKKVLLVDLDPQGSLSKCAGFRDLKGSPTAYEVIMGDVNIKDAIRTKEAVAPYDILPIDIRMSGAELKLVNVPGRDFLLKEALESVKRKYDYVLIDCSPSLNIFTLMALTASNKYIIPVTAQYMPLEGMAQLIETADRVKKILNKRLELGGVIVAMYDNRRSLDREVIEAIRNRFPKEIFKTVVKNNSKLAEAPAKAKDIFEYDAKSSGAEAYRELTKEIIEREG